MQSRGIKRHRKAVDGNQTTAAGEDTGKHQQRRLPDNQKWRCESTGTECAFEKPFAQTRGLITTGEV